MDVTNSTSDITTSSINIIYHLKTSRCHNICSKMRLSLPLTLCACLNLALGENATGVFIPPEYTYLLPTPFQGPQAVDGNFSTNYINTVTANASINALFKSAQNATYFALDKTFYEILGGDAPEIQLIQMRSTDFAYEAGAWDYDTNRVWFTSEITSPPTYVSILDLKPNTITTPEIPELRNVNYNGGYYFQGKMYLAIAGNESVPDVTPGVYAVDTTTYAVTPILNSWFGEALESVDDLTWTTCGTAPTQPTLFFTSLNLGASGIKGVGGTSLPDAVYRFSPLTQSLQAVISRADIVEPNGIRSDATGRHLFVTGRAAPFNVTFGSSVIYRFTLDDDCFPVNKRLIGTVRSYADGLHIDDYGRVWTGEFDGIVVRSPTGKVLGVFNAEALQDRKGASLANFALAGDKLVILAVDRLYVLQLGQNVTSKEARTQ